MTDDTRPKFDLASYFLDPHKYELEVKDGYAILASYSPHNTLTLVLTTHDLVQLYLLLEPIAQSLLEDEFERTIDEMREEAQGAEWFDPIQTRALVAA